MQREREMRGRRARGGRDARHVGRRTRRALLFGGSLLIGALLARSLVAEAVRWQSGHPPRLERISVVGNQRLQAREVAEATGLAKSQSLDGLRLADLEERLAQHPWIRSARAALLPTGTLILDVEEREARAVVRETDAEARFVDADCVPFAPVDSAQPSVDPRLPALRSLTPRATGLADRELCRALSLAEEVRGLAGADASAARNEYAASEVVLPEPDSELGWVLRAPSGASVILGSGPPEQLSIRLASLERLLDSRLTTVEQASTIDLRFADQAVLRGLATREGPPEGGG